MNQNADYPEDARGDLSILKGISVAARFTEVGIRRGTWRWFAMFGLALFQCVL